MSADQHLQGPSIHSLHSPSAGERLLYSTIKISTRGSDGSSTGTGFYFELAAGEDGHIPVIITNKHVVEDAALLELNLHIATKDGRNPSGRFKEFLVPITPERIIWHSSADVDLAAIRMDDIIYQHQHTDEPIFYVAMVFDIVPKDDDWKFLDPIEEVVMVGCPNGIYDEFNNFPIIRSGRTASWPAKEYQGKKEFLVDMACFPGSSGSPIFIYNSFSYFDKKQMNYVAGRPRLLLIGILYSGPFGTSPVVDADGNPVGDVEAMIHLGTAIRASELKDLDRQMRHILAEATSQT